MNGNYREAIVGGVAARGAIVKSKDFRSLEDQVGEIIFLATGGESGGGP